MADKTEQFGPGIVGVVKGDILILQIDLTNDLGFSGGGTGKMRMVATTSGNRPTAFGDGRLVKVGVNIFRDPTLAEQQERAGVTIPTLEK